MSAQDSPFNLLAGIPAWSGATNALDALVLAERSLRRCVAALAESGDRTDAERMSSLWARTSVLTSDLRHALEKISSEASAPAQHKLDAESAHNLAKADAVEAGNESRRKP